MNTPTAVRKSLDLLKHRDRRLFKLMVTVQMFTAFLDLLGVFLLGVVAVLATATTQGTAPPTIVEDVFSILGLGSLEPSAIIGVVGGLAAMILILKSCLSLLLTQQVFRFLAKRAAGVSADLSARFFSSPLLIVQANPSQETAYALGPGANAAVLGVLGSGMIVVTELALLAVLGVALLFVDPVVTVGAILYFAFLAAVMQRPLSRWASRIGQAIATTEISSTTIVQEGIDCYREVSVLDRRAFYRDRYRETRRESTTAAANGQILSLIPKGAMEVALVIGAVALVLSQALTQDLVGAAGTLVLFLVAGSRVMPSILRLQSGLAIAHNSAANAANTYALHDELPPLTPRFGGDSGRLGAGVDGSYLDFIPEIHLEGVSVTYPSSNRPALNAISVTVPIGRSLALVGSTGAGKSTLADIILGVLSPDSGSVLISDLEPREASQRWPGAIAYVPQSVALGSGTVRDNVALGLPRADIDDDLVWASLERAHLAEYLRSTREGLDTRVGEHGVRLSGGQRQRLGVARALYTRPRLLVLDEATSALDAETEAAIAQTMRELEGDVTTVVVAHRLATIRHSDTVLYLEQGSIQAMGTFDEVRRAVPAFARQAQLLGL